MVTRFLGVCALVHSMLQSTKDDLKNESSKFGFTFSHICTVSQEKTKIYSLHFKAIIN